MTFKSLKILKNQLSIVNGKKFILLHFNMFPFVFVVVLTRSSCNFILLSFGQVVKTVNHKILVKFKREFNNTYRNQSKNSFDFILIHLERRNIFIKILVLSSSDSLLSDILLSSFLFYVFIPYFKV